jgi:hypothetical protein
MSLNRIACLPIGLLVCLAQAAFPQCQTKSDETLNAVSNSVSASARLAEQRQVENRTVVLMLSVSKSGAVRDARVVRGPTTLVEAAIKAVKVRKYNPEIVYGRSNVWKMTVEVEFPEHKDEALKIQQVVIGGVPGCVSGVAMGAPPTPWSGVLPPWLNLLLSVQPITLVSAHEPLK